jgi:hypothetical protein
MMWSRMRLFFESFLLLLACRGALPRIEVKLFLDNQTNRHGCPSDCAPRPATMSHLRRQSLRYLNGTAAHLQLPSLPDLA